MGKIIDRVDVGFCRFFFDKFYNVLDNACTEGNPIGTSLGRDCYYKQLRRQNKTIAILKEKIKTQKSELERYKSEIMTLRNGYDEDDCTNTCPNMQSDKAEIRSLKNQLCSYVDALADIREEYTALKQIYSDCEKEYRALTVRYHELQAELSAYKELKKNEC